MELCENCAKKAEKLEACPYCQKQFCSSCFPRHMSWERQHQDWSLYQSAGPGMTNVGGSREVMSYGPPHKAEGKRKRYRRSKD